MTAFTATIDTREQQAWLRRYLPAEVERVLEEASKAGGRAAARVLKEAAPVGSSDHEGQYYRRKGLGHGTFRDSVKTAKIRGRGTALSMQGRTVGQVIGPMGPNAFTRNWLENGTSGPGRHRQRGTGWVERSAGRSLDEAQWASEAVLDRYVDGS